MVGAVGCAPITRNREVPVVELTGHIAGQGLEPTQRSRLLDDRVEQGFADLTVVQYTPDGVVELTLVFTEGLDRLVEPRSPEDDERFDPNASILVTARAGDGRGAWHPPTEGRVLSVDSYLDGETDPILTPRWRGEREYRRLDLLIDFDLDYDSAAPTTALSEEGAAPPHPQQVAQQVVVDMHYHRDRVRRRSQRGADPDEC